MAVFSEAFLRLRQDFDQGHENRGKLIRDIRADVRELSRQTVSQIAEQSRTRRAAFAAMMGGLRETIQQQATQTRQQLAELAADLHHGGEVFGRAKPARQHSRKFSPVERSL
jgi:Ser/Thr protein kinase RdoA (MazF antagonist)